MNSYVRAVDGRRIRPFLAAMAVVSSLVLTPFAISSEAQAEVPSEDPRVLDVLAQDDRLNYLGTPVSSQIPSQAAHDVVDGRHVSYQLFKGVPDSETPATFVMTDVETGEELDTCNSPTAEHSRNLNIADDGRVYWGTYYDSKLWRYDPAVGECEDLGHIDPDDGRRADAFGVSPGPDGSMFLGVYPDSRLYQVDPDTGEAVLLHEEIDVGADYIHTIAYHDESDSVIVGTGGVVPKFWRIPDGGHGEPTLLVDDSDAPGLDAAGQFAGRMDIVHDLAIAQVGLRMLVFDLEGNVVHWDVDQTRFHFGHHTIPGAEPGEAIFSTEGGALLVYDTATNETRETGINIGGYLSHGVVDPSSGTPLLYGTSATGVFVADLASGELISDSEVSFQQPTVIQKLLNGPDGSLWASGYMVGLAEIDTTGAEHGETMQRGQYESAVVRDGTMYLGAYGHSKLEALDPETFDPADPTTVPRLFEGQAEGQDRPFGMAYNPERDEIYMGSVAIYGQTQGGLAIWDGATGEHVWLTEEIGEDENIVSVAYNDADGLVYLGSTVDGGLGSEPSGNTAGKLIIFDPETRTVIDVIDPVGEEREGITGLMVDDQGVVWGVAEEALFAYDPATKTSEVRGTVGGAYAEGVTYWAYGNVSQSATDGKIYVTAGSRFSVHDPVNAETTAIAEGVDWSTVDETGDVWLSAGPHLFRYDVPDPAPACDETVTGEVDGGLVVRAGESFCLDGATINGGVNVSEDGMLISTDTRINGGLSADGARSVELRESDIRGGVSLTSTAGALIVAGNDIRGGLTCSDNALDPLDEGVPNAVRGPQSGQCSEL